MMNTYFKFAGIATLGIGTVIFVTSKVDATTINASQPTNLLSNQLLKQSLVLQDYTPPCIGQQCSGPVDSRGSGTR